MFDSPGVNVAAECRSGTVMVAGTLTPLILAQTARNMAADFQVLTRTRIEILLHRSCIGLSAASFFASCGLCATRAICLGVLTITIS